MSRFTPLIRQYLSIKNRYKDAILFFRMGDFYEMFFDDAKMASRELDIALTSRDKNKKEAVPMCGVPYHSAATYINRLLEKGYKVAICEQMEDPSTAKDLVRREVVRILSPGMVIDPENIPDSRNNYIMAIHKNQKGVGIAFLDITTGDFKTSQLQSIEDALNEIFTIMPKEVILPYAEKNGGISAKIEKLFRNITITFLEDWLFEKEFCLETLKDHFNIAAVEGLGISKAPAAISAAGALLHYVKDTQRSHLPHVRSIRAYQKSDFVQMDESTQRNLELFETLAGGTEKGTLLDILDFTATAMGARTLREWIKRPLLEIDEIKMRLDAVEELISKRKEREDIRTILKEVRDLERIVGKISLNNAAPRDLFSLKISAGRIPGILTTLKNFRSPLLKEIASASDLSEVHKILDESIKDDPPASLSEGDIIKEGFNKELDELRKIIHQGRRWIAELEQEEKKRTGIQNLKIGYNRVFGYYIEVTKSQISKVPDDYERKQTLVGGERFTSSKLKEYETRILGAEERLAKLEKTVFEEICREISGWAPEILETARKLAYLDVLACFATAAELNDYTKPVITDEKIIRIKEGRHPVIEKMNLEERFVPNDIFLDSFENKMIILTGPNMAGKSTAMRQVALIVLMAQAGSFVPARRAEIGIVDKIFVRAGAVDYLGKGMSTFMVEMVETASILNSATERSLIILDEIGRGTSTYDGISIAWAVAEYIYDTFREGPRTIFATHYHELTELAANKPGIKNFNVAVREKGDQITFIRKLQPGGTSKSYGIQVAKLAGMPAEVVDRAFEILGNLQKNTPVEPEKEKKPAKKTKKNTIQLELFDQKDELEEKLLKLDINNITPLAALNILSELKQIAQNNHGRRRRPRAKL